MNTNPLAPLAQMTEIARVTLRQLMGRRRTLLLLLLAALPVLIAVAFRASNSVDATRFIRSSFDGVTVTILMPLVAILFGTGAFGAEIDEGTVVYLLAKPVRRFWIVLAKAVTAMVMAILLTGASTAVAGLIVVGSETDGLALTEAQLVAVAVGSICYVALFQAVSLFTRRALVIGIGYMLIWEGALSVLLSGIANFSIRQYALASAGLVHDLPIEAANLTTATGITLAAVLVVAATAAATWKLRRLELTGSGD